MSHHARWNALCIQIPTHRKMGCPLGSLCTFTICTVQIILFSIFVYKFFFLELFLFIGSLINFGFQLCARIEELFCEKEHGEAGLHGIFCQPHNNRTMMIHEQTSFRFFKPDSNTLNEITEYTYISLKYTIAQFRYKTN